MVEPAEFDAVSFLGGAPYWQCGRLTGMARRLTGMLCALLAMLAQNLGTAAATFWTRPGPDSGHGRARFLVVATSGFWIVA
jgi:hypothetical protein